jgi:SAM-dependent methyltransferase
VSLTDQEMATAQWYEDNGRQWVDSHASEDFWGAEMARFCAHLQPGADVLEIGSGGGRDARHFLSRGYGYLGTDVSPEMVTIAQERVPAGRFVLANPYQMNLGERRFAGWWAAASLGVHVPPERIGAALSELSRYLEGGAPGFISVKPGSLTERAIDGSGRWFTYWDIDEMHGLLERAGMAVIERGILHGKDCGTRGWGWLISRFVGQEKAAWANPLIPRS